MLDLFRSLPPFWQLMIVVTLAALELLRRFFSLTDTPPPNTTYGRIYAFLEWLSGLNAKAKQIGLPVVTPQDVVMRLGAALAAGQPLTPAQLADVLGKPANVAPVSKPASVSGAVAATVGLLLIAGIGLAACAGAPPATTVFDLRAGYDATVLAPMAGYAQLPACPASGAATSTAPEASPVCSDANVLAQLVKADTAAKAALDAAENTVRTAPDMDASTAIAAAENAIAAVQTILTAYNIH